MEESSKSSTIGMGISSIGRTLTKDEILEQIKINETKKLNNEVLNPGFKPQMALYYRMKNGTIIKQDLKTQIVFILNQFREWEISVNAAQLIASNSDLIERDYYFKDTYNEKKNFRYYKLIDGSIIKINQEALLLYVLDTEKNQWIEDTEMFVEFEQGNYCGIEIKFTDFFPVGESLVSNKPKKL